MENARMENSYKMKMSQIENYYKTTGNVQELKKQQIFAMELAKRHEENMNNNEIDWTTTGTEFSEDADAERRSRQGLLQYIIESCIGRNDNKIRRNSNNLENRTFTN